MDLAASFVCIPCFSMIRKLKGPNHIADHIEKRGYRHNYVLYYTGADYYDLPYWTFVHLAKDAGATVELHRLAVADTLAIDRYLDDNCLVLPEETGRKESVREMKDRDDLYQMISGHRRLYAAKKAGLTTIPAIIKDSIGVKRIPFQDGLFALIVLVFHLIHSLQEALMPHPVSSL